MESPQPKTMRLGSSLSLQEFDAISRAQSSQRQNRSTSLSRLAGKGLKKTARFIVLSVCRMRLNRNKGFTKDGEYIEVRVPPNAAYEEVAALCAEAVHLTKPVSADYITSSLVVLRANKMVVQNKAVCIDATSGATVPWTIENYLSTIPSFAKSRQCVRVGIAYKQEAELVDSSGEESERGERPNEPVNKEVIEVLYSPNLGGLVGLDVDILESRFQAFQAATTTDGMSESDALTLMDERTPWHPEMTYYMVSRLSRDETVLLALAADETYAVHEDVGARFQVLHQSPRNVVLMSNAAVPLYCVVAGQSCTFGYEWTVGGQVIGSASPVLWVNQPGLYKCQVSHDVMSETCSSHLIEVTRLGSGSGGDTVLRETTLEDSESQRISEGQEQSQSPEQSEGSASGMGGAMIFRESILMEATDTFSCDNVVGKGGFGKVYKGSLFGTSVAVKVLSEHGTRMLVKSSSQLKNEVESLTKYNHPNILTLMGYCLQPPMLVFPFMDAGSLFKNLHEWKVDKPLSWSQRVAVLTDTARGLTYLHTSEPPLVHHDINTSNILLGPHGEARICDFGFSIELPERKGGKTLITALKHLALPGTLGYLPPEFNEGRYSTWSDVYSYGVVVLETYTGLLAYSEERDDHRLVDHFDEELRDVQQFAKGHDQKPGVCPEEAVKVLYCIATCCMKNSYKKRLEIKHVLAKLQAFVVVD